MNVSQSLKMIAAGLLLTMAAFAQEEKPVEASSWTLPDGVIANGSGAPQAPMAGPVNYVLTFAETEIPLETSIDGVTINSLNGTAIAPLAFGFSSADAGFTATIGPPTLTLSAFPWIEGDSAGTMTIDFGTDITSFGADMTLSTIGAVTDIAIVTAFNLEGGIVGTASVNGDDLGNGFSEGHLSFTGDPFRRVELTFNDAAAARFLMDNLSYSAAPSGAVPTLGEYALITFIVLLAGTAVFMRRRMAA